MQRLTASVGLAVSVCLELKCGAQVSTIKQRMIRRTGFTMNANMTVTRFEFHLISYLPGQPCINFNIVFNGIVQATWRGITFPIGIHLIAEMDTNPATNRCRKSIVTFLRRCCSNQGTIPQFGDLIS